MRSNPDAVATVLLEHGARTDVRDNEGRAPLRVARDLNGATLLLLLSTARTKEIQEDDATADPALHTLRRNSILGSNYVMPLLSAVRILGRDGLVTYLDIGRSAVRSR